MTDAGDAEEVDVPIDASVGPGLDEYATRLANVRAAMAERSFAALVVTDPANIYYLTGYNAWSFYTPQCLVVPADGDIRFFARTMDAEAASDISILRDDQVERYPEALVHRPDTHPFDWIARRGLETGVFQHSSEVSIGLEGDSQFFSVRGFRALYSAMPEVNFAESNEMVNWVRLVKSPYEQEMLRRAGKVATHVMTTALETMHIGQRQCDAVGDIMAAQAKGTDEYGGDYSAIVPLLPTGKKAGVPHLTWSEDPFVAGDATALELSGVYHRYHAPLARTVSFGRPPSRLSSLAGAVMDGMAATLAHLYPGSSPQQAHRAFTEVMGRKGLTKESRIGYSIGIGYPPDWGERTVSLRAGEHTELKAGMAFHVILGMWLDTWGYVLSEPVLITNAGAERLASMPQDLTVKG